MGRRSRRKAVRILTGGYVSFFSPFPHRIKKPHLTLPNRVSKLLKSICNPEQVIEEFHDGYVPLSYFCYFSHFNAIFRVLDISPERKVVIEHEVGVWRFSAHSLTDDELVHAAFAMIGHAMAMPELEAWRLTKGLLALRLDLGKLALTYSSRTPHIFTGQPRNI
jgi:hypothetical protein